MTTTTKTAAATAATTARFGFRALAVTGVAATAIASLPTVTVAAAGNAAGISLEVNGAPIPVPGFGTLTAVFSLVGLVLAAVLSRFARPPRRTFVRTTIVLTALSLVPDAIVAAAPATKALLMLTHL